MSDLRNNTFSFEFSKFNHPINLGASCSAPQIVSSGELTIKRQTKWGILKSLSGYLELSIEFDGNNHLVFSDRDHFLTFHNGEPRYIINEPGATNEVSIVLHPEYLIDCEINHEDLRFNENDLYSCPIQFKIIITDSRDVQVICECVCIADIALRTPVLKAKLKLDQDELEWFDTSARDEKMVKIGSLVLSHGCEQKCSPSITVDVSSLHAKCGNINNSIFLKWDEMVESNHKLLPSDDGVNITTGEGESCLIKTTYNNLDRLEKIYAHPQKIGDEFIPNEISIPLYWVLPSVNPDKDLEFDIEVLLDWFFTKHVHKENSEVENQAIKATHKTHKTFLLKRNIHETELEVRAGFGVSQVIKETDTLSHRHDVPFSIYPNQPGNIPVVIDICNKAQANDKNGSVIVWDFKINYYTSSETSAVTTEQDFGRYITLNELTGHTCLAYHEPIKRESFSLVIPLMDLIPILGDERTMVLTIQFSFKYILDKEGKYWDLAQANKYDKIIADADDSIIFDFTSDLSCLVTKAPMPEWVSIDFGTSAVAAAKGIGNNLTILDLKTTKIDKVLRPNYAQEPQKVSEVEPGKIISSVVAFNPVGQEAFDDKLDKVETYKGLPLWLSPSPKMISPGSQLPCLKYLATTRSLPQGEFNLGPMTYNDKDGNAYKGFERIDQYGNTYPIGLGKVDNVFDSVYRQLLKLFIIPALTKDAHNSSGLINKMVLTIPNTFTPVHLAELKELVERVFPDVWPEYLTFVSESDAVACYFVYNNRRFLKTVADKKLSEKLSSQERVLVYDMGAGTLDLTFFEFTNTGGKSRLDIKGKMGVSRAGDNLDYCLAEILVDLIKDVDTKNDFMKRLELDLETRNNTATNFTTVNQFKEYVKRMVKPMLNADETTKLPAYQENEKEELASTFDEISIGDIKSHDKYKDYIKYSTTEVLESFLSMFGITKESVDIVVFSGRSSTLGDIRIGVADFFNNDKILFADIQNEKMVSRDNLAQVAVSSNDKMKTIVAMGAIATANMKISSKFTLNNPTIFASYGAIVTSRLSADTRYWYPLFNLHHDIVHDTADNDGLLYDSTSNYDNIIDAADCECIVFVQCFSSNPSMDVNQNDFSKMTNMYVYPLNGSEGNVRISLRINTNQQLQFFVNSVLMQDDSRAKINFDDVALRKSLWPVLLSDNRKSS